mgnify:CR=1 FL=1
MATNEQDSQDTSCSTGPRKPDQIVGQIQGLSESIDDPENWRVLVPVEVFDEVKDQLETQHDLGTYYDGITLCYTQHHEQARVEYTNTLSDHTQTGEE